MDQQNTDQPAKQEHPKASAYAFPSDLEKLRLHAPHAVIHVCASPMKERPGNPTRTGESCVPLYTLKDAAAIIGHGIEVGPDGYPESHPDYRIAQLKRQLLEARAEAEVLRQKRAIEFESEFVLQVLQGFVVDLRTSKPVEVSLDHYACILTAFMQGKRCAQELPKEIKPYENLDSNS